MTPAPLVEHPSKHDRTRIVAGQTWRHHTMGDYRVFGLNPHDGRVRLCRTDSMQAAAEVWPDYLRANFRLVQDAS